MSLRYSSLSRTEKRAFDLWHLVFSLLSQRIYSSARQPTSNNSRPLFLTWQSDYTGMCYKHGFPIQLMFGALYKLAITISSDTDSNLNLKVMKVSDYFPCVATKLSVSLFTLQVRLSLRHLFSQNQTNSMDKLTIIVQSDKTSSVQYLDINKNENNKYLAIV